MTKNLYVIEKSVKMFELANLEEVRLKKLKKEFDNNNKKKGLDISFRAWKVA